MTLGHPRGLSVNRGLGSPRNQLTPELREAITEFWASVFEAELRAETATDGRNPPGTEPPPEAVQIPAVTR